MPHDIDAERDLLREATAQLVRTVDGLDDAAFREPSRLPDWTRGHVVAHLALNSEGLAGALSGIVRGEPTPMYASQEARDGDIAELSGAEPSVLRDRLLGGSTEFDDATLAVPEEGWSGQVERTVGGPSFTAAAAVGMRLREVEIHHADLDAGYTPASWSTEFCQMLLDGMARREHTSAFRVAPSDLAGTWVCGEGGPTVSGTAADLAWWLTGRGDGSTLTCDDGSLPVISSW